MELEKLERLAQRSVRVIRRLLGSAPSVPLQAPTDGLEDRVPDEQCPAVDEQHTDSPSRPPESPPEPDNNQTSGAVEEDQETPILEGTAPALDITTDTTNCLIPTNIAGPSHQGEATSITTSGYTNVDSLGFETVLTSSSSAPPSEIVASSDFVGAVVFARKVIVAPNMRHKIDQELLSAWDKKISLRLWNDLDRLGTGAVVALEFHMAGQSKKRLKPTIIITCDDAKSQKHNTEKVKGLKWLQPYRLNCCVVKNSDKRRLLALTKADENSTFPSVIANISADTTTLCGVPATLKYPSMDNMTPFRLGGLIMVDTETFCLTAGHMVAVPSCTGDLSTTVTQAQSSDNNSTTEADDSSIIFTIGELMGDDDTEIESDGLDEENGVYAPAADHGASETASKLGLSDGSKWARLGNLTSSFPHEEVLETQRSISSPSDWGLIQLADSKHWLPNTVHLPGETFERVIEDITTKDELSSGLVWVITASVRPRPGFLTLGTAFVFLYGSRFLVQQIALEDALGMFATLQYLEYLFHGLTIPVPGDSGSWVIKDGRLCGYIIAGRPGLKWAYMISIEDVFADIKKTFSAGQVRLPRAPENCSLREGVTLQNHPSIQFKAEDIRIRGETSAERLKLGSDRQDPKSAGKIKPSISRRLSKTLN